MRFRENTPAKIGVTLALAAGLALAADAACEVKAHADPMPPNCLVQPWGFLGAQQRGFCDTPMSRDGSWTRHRVIGVPAHYVPVSGTTNCFGTSFVTCNSTSTGGYFQPYIELDNEIYLVTAATVLPDEPGHLG